MGRIRTIREYLELPWSIDVERRTDDGEYVVARVRELPGFVATGETDDELERSFWNALEDHIRSYLEDREEPPLPEGAAEVFERNDALEARVSFEVRMPEGDDGPSSSSTHGTQEKEEEGGVLRDREREVVAA